MAAPMDPDRQCIAAFFGDDIAMAWSHERPHALLGLVTAEYPASVVQATLAKRTAFVNLHPLRATAQAERVRMLLRDAAERLAGGQAGGQAGVAVQETPPLATAPPAAVPQATAPRVAAPSAPVPFATVPPVSPPSVIRPAAPAPVAPPVVASAQQPVPAAVERSVGGVAAGQAGPGKTVAVVIPVAEEGPLPLAEEGGSVVPAPLPLAQASVAPVVMQSVGSAGPAPLSPAMDQLVRYAAHAVASGETAGPVLLARLVQMASGLGQPPAVAEQAMRLFLQQGLAPPLNAPPAAAAGTGGGQAEGGRPSWAPQATVAAAASASRGPWLGVAVGGATIVVLLIITAIWFSALLGRSDEQTAGPAPAPAAPVAPVAEGETAPSVLPQAGRSGRAVTDAITGVVEAGEVRRQIRSAAQQLQDGNSAGALRGLAAAARSAGISWLSHTPPERLVIVNEIIDVLLLLPPDRTTLAVVDLVPISGGPLSSTGVLTETWTAGTLARLSREREASPGLLTPAVERLVELTGRAAGPGGAVWPAGAAASLAGMPGRLVAGQSPEASVAAGATWEQAVRAIWSVPSGLPEAGADQATAARLAENVLLDGIERLLVTGSEPSDDRAMYDMLFAFAARQRWRSDDGSRERLLRWFADERVSGADLHVLTAAIVGRSSAEGVDMSMVLAAGADAAARQVARAAFAQAWGLERAAGGRAARGRMYQRLDEAAARSASLGAPDGDLRAVLNFAMVSRVGAGYVTGMDPGDVVDAATLPSGAAKIRYTEGGGANGDGEWAARFLSERSAALRLERLRELDTRGSPLGPVDAEVLVEAAVLGTADVRTAAERILPKFGSELTVVNGLLEILPRAPRRRSLMDTIAQVAQRPLIGVPPERWLFEARKSLVERALELMSTGDADVGRVDEMVIALAGHYQAMAGTASATAPLENEASDALIDAAAALGALLRRQAEQLVPSREAPLRLDEVQARFQARMAAAVGPIQRFACHQLMIVETAAYITAISRPADAPRVAEVLAQMSASRRRATHIFGQLRAVEQAIAELWTIAAEGGRS
ncbi:MAG: hypothetical protein LW650_03465 [Planctomycetaceae bacterium]|jgi:hypothetical protein|nr:hypothetical protein [Phycisphaerales bacterium]MCE2652571.1 hypothetical protein [Planctomycetaceae bacterium]